MARVTKLEKGSTKGIKLFLDGEYAGLLYPTDLRRYRVKENEEVSEDTMDKIHKLMLQRARQKAITYLENGEQSASMLRFKLRQKGYNENIIDEVLTFMQQYHYQDDYRYAQMYIMYHADRKSSYELKQYLRCKGVSDALIDQAMEENGVDESKALKKHLMHRMKSIDEQDEKEKQKLFLSAVRKGFSYNLVVRCYDELLSEYYIELSENNV